MISLNHVTRAVVVMLGALAVASMPAASPKDDFALSQHAGRVVVVDFWASWCVPCRRSFPWLNSMHDKYGDAGLVIIGVNLDNKVADAEEFLREFPAKFRIHYDEDKALAKEFGVVAMPSTFVAGRNGQIVARHFGFKVKKQNEYEAVIVEALRNAE